MSEQNRFLSWIGLSVADAAESLFQAELKRKSPKHITILGSSFKTNRSVSYQSYYENFWSSFDTFTKTVYDSFGSIEDRLFEEYESCAILSGLVPNNFYRRWNACSWFINAVEPLISTLENGLIGIQGQREPVNYVDQSFEPVPYNALGDRRWRLYREKSRIQIFDLNNALQATFRRCVIAAPMLSNHAQPFQVTTIKQLPAMTTEAPTQLELKIIALLKRDFSLINGSRKISSDFQKKYPEFNLSIKYLSELVDKARGSSLRRGRPTGKRAK